MSIEIRFLLILTLSCVIHKSMVDTSCQLFDRCCVGRSNECVAKDAKDETCYCDEGCRKTNDCCADYVSYCLGESNDCKVSQWSRWSRCNKQCGLGKQKRRRTIITPAKNAGKPCPGLEQNKICFGTTCRQRKSRLQIQREKERLIRNPARILPYELGDWRKNKLYNPAKDVRSNLYHHYKSFRSSSIERANYCNHFEISGVRDVCLSTNWTSALQKGEMVCVECQHSAMKGLNQRCKGDGFPNQQGRWFAVNVLGCHGYWIKRAEQRNCRCNYGHGKDFILV